MPDVVSHKGTCVQSRRVFFAHIIFSNASVFFVGVHIFARVNIGQLLGLGHSIIGCTKDRLHEQIFVPLFLFQLFHVN
jgi:hypothetical protein